LKPNSGCVIFGIMLRLRPSPLSGLATALKVAAVAGAGLCVYAFSQPTTLARSIGPYSEKVTIESSPEGSGPDRSRATMLHIKAVYDFTADGPHLIGGTMGLVAETTDDTGMVWRLPLAPATPFSGAHAEQTGTLAVADIPAGGADIVAEVTVAGSLGEKPITTHFASNLPIDAEVMKASPDTNGTLTASHVLGSTVRAPNRAELLGGSVQVDVLRRAGLALGAIGVLGQAIIGERVRHRVVTVELPGPNDVVVDVTDMVGLVRLADRAGKVIAHERTDDDDTYSVRVHGTVYRYRAECSEPAASRPHGLGC
jgi:hypothetical protein